jgi:hypothetical protein
MHGQQPHSDQPGEVRKASSKRSRGSQPQKYFGEKWKTFKGDNRLKIYKRQFGINLASCL